MKTQEIKTQKTVANLPNAGKLIKAMQNMGYTPETAICDIIDNSIDAGASNIQIFTSQTKGEKDEDGEFRADKSISIMIVDDGCGMNYATLDQALKFGSETSHEDSSDLGKFGMGLSSAGLSLADITTVLTKCEDDIVYYSRTDLNEIVEKNEFTKQLDIATDEQVKFFNSYIKSSSGTIVMFDDCTGVRVGIKSLNNIIRKSISVVFRKFLLPSGNLSITLNGEAIEPFDMFIEKGIPELNIKPTDTKIYANKDINIHWNDENGNRHESIVHIKIGLLPFLPKTMKDGTKDKYNDIYEIGPAKQGWSILRNNREIAHKYVPSGWKNVSQKHPEWNRVKCELSFLSDADYAMGVNVKKDGILMSDTVNDILKPLIEGTYTLIRQNVREAQAQEAVENNDIDSSNASAIIKGKSKMLTKFTNPNAKSEEEVEKRNTHTRNNDNHNEMLIKDVKDEPRKRRPKETHKVNKKNTYALDCEWEYENKAPNDQFFTVAQNCGTTIVRINVNHPFYKKFLVNNQDNKETLTAIQLFIYSLARSTYHYQYEFENDDVNIAVEEVVGYLSNDLYKLLKDL